ncbi:BadF/BadG/BcrA/BcrD ATPase family protein [Cyanobium sp. FACHB-13342]|uniref:N-acetylglucosamine kinase n=1 Tax=Cyanobium sp. FACHB-13342 TaxID=2692793 RepID=UPI00321FBCE7
MAELALIAGFDAGQTHTSCRLSEVNSPVVLAEGEGPGVCHLAAPDGPSRFRRALQASLDNACGQLKAQGQLRAAAIGASGVEVGSPVQSSAQALAAEALGLALPHVVVTGDERTALRGAMGNHRAGIVVISGTGTIAVGRNAAGVEHRCAGWGWLLDGAGSAMDLGRDGLALSLEMADGRRPESPLRARIWAGLGLAADDPEAAQAIKALVVTPEFGPAGFARLAPLVVAAAAEDDPTASAVVERSALALARMVATISQRLELVAPPVWPMGGALEHLELLRSQLAAHLEILCPGARLLPPAGDACSGALNLARDCLNNP